MTAKPRYAVYYAPANDDPIWALGSEWLGRDAYGGGVVPRRAIAAFSNREIDELTASPRRYGFHATMKAPFELSDVQTEGALLDFADTFAADQSPFEVALTPQALGKFLALRLVDSSEAMTALHTDCVKAFDAFRAPLSEADIARRRRSNLTPEQDARMLEWGYPYIFDQFRWHMTLSNKIEDDDLRARLLAVLQDLFAEACRAPHEVNGVAVYKQDDRDAPFVILKRVHFSN